VAGQVQVKGGARLRSTLRKAGADLGDLKDANQKVGQFIAQESTPIAPRGKTGRLAGSVRSARQVGRARVLAGNAAVPYAGVIHFGWPAHNIAPQPWIQTTAVATEPTWLPIYEADVQDICDSVKGA
jgi:hypothetical protein